MRLVRLAAPEHDQLESMRLRLVSESFSYEPGILGGSIPSGMSRDTLEVGLGSGEDVYQKAREALRNWVPFGLEWAGISTGGRAPTPGLDVVVFASLLGVNFTAACRVVTTHEAEDGTEARCGFTYGSLQSHLETGEELFEVVRGSDGKVTYRIDVMARPGRWYTRLAKPLAEHYRRRFRQDSAAAMRRFVSE